MALELLALGAPAELVAATHRAALDEVEHARTCFAIAARLDSTRSAPGPGRLALEGLALATTPAALAERLVTEGCVGEALAALVLREAAERCADPAIAGAVRRMAEDEAEHAALAFRTAAWLVATHGEPVREAIRREAARAHRVDFHVPDLGADAAAVGGRLDADAIGGLVASGLREVVAPCLDALDRA